MQLFKKEDEEGNYYYIINGVRDADSKIDHTSFFKIIIEGGVIKITEKIEVNSKDLGSYSTLFDIYCG